MKYHVNIFSISVLVLILLNSSIRTILSNKGTSFISTATEFLPSYPPSCYQIASLTSSCHCKGSFPEHWPIFCHLHATITKIQDKKNVFIAYFKPQSTNNIIMFLKLNGAHPTPRLLTNIVKVYNLTFGAYDAFYIHQISLVSLLDSERRISSALTNLLCFQGELRPNVEPAHISNHDGRHLVPRRQ